MTDQKKHDYEAIYVEAEKMGLTKDLIPAFMTWEKTGDMIIGRYLHHFAVEGEGDKGSYNQYVFETNEGKVKFSLGSLADKEVSSQLEHGGLYAIKFLGKEKIGNGRQVNRFSVRECQLPTDFKD